MSFNLRPIFLFCSLFYSVISHAYPVVKDWKNKPSVIFETKDNLKLSKNEELKLPCLIETFEGDEIQLSMNLISDLFLFKNTKIHFYEVFEDKHLPQIFHLAEGKVRIKSKKIAGKQVHNQINNVFFDLPIPLNTDILVEIDMSEPSVQIKMLEGTWHLEFYSYEKKVDLKAGQQIKFTAVAAPEPYQIRYDYLLNGKKVPKGQLGEVQKFDVAKYKAIEKAAEAEIIKKDLAAKQKIKEALRKKKEYEDTFLCKSPFAQINQCAWKLESRLEKNENVEKCYRQRCNVSGEWGDKTERPITDQCTKEFLIGKCDY